jgi:hypothetical protein
MVQQLTGDYPAAATSHQQALDLRQNGPQPASPRPARD